MTTPIFLGEDQVTLPERALFVVAHPDDIDFGSAGTAAVLTAAGSHVSYCLVTSGQAGNDDMSMSTEDLAAMRQREQTAAAAEVGVTSLHWLGFPDGAVECNLELRKAISRVIRIEKPDVVMTQQPTRAWDSVYRSHPDHIETGEATMRAVYPDARNPRAFPELLAEGYEPHAVPAVWMNGLEPDLFIDISGVFDKKVAALKSHVSQTADMGDRLMEILTTWGALNARKAGLAEGRYAEGFKLLVTA